LYGAQLVAIDGSKFKAVNSKSNNLNEKTVALRLKRTEEKIAQYLKEMDENDKADPDKTDTNRVDDLKEKINQLEEKKQQYEAVQSQMKQTTGQKEVSLVDPDSRLMRVSSQRLEVSYNIQTSVDAKRHLIVDYDVINNSTDHHQLVIGAIAAKQTLEVDQLEVVSDKGFYVEKDIVDCESKGITVFMPIPAFNPTKNVGVPKPEFSSDRFVYHDTMDCYVCPMEKELVFWKRNSKGCEGKGFIPGRLYRTALYGSCSSRNRCTRNRLGRVMVRSQFEDVIDRLRARVESSDGRAKFCRRRELVEHPFGTMEGFQSGLFAFEGAQESQRRSGIYNAGLQHEKAINILGVGTLIALVKA
jgi:hypothetical protein